VPAINIRKQMGGNAWQKQSWRSF